LKDQVQQRLGAVWSGVQQTLLLMRLASVEWDAILNTVAITVAACLLLNGWTFRDFC